MKTSDYFNLGCKLFGVYFLVLSVPLFISAISTFLPQEQSSSNIDKYLFFYTLVTRLLPVIYVVIGFGLITKSEKVFVFAYRNAPPNINENSEKFRLFLKMLGIYLFAEYLPMLINSISSYLTYSNAPKVFDFITQHNYVTEKFFPSVIAIALGFYLIIDGEIFVKLGFRAVAITKEKR